MLHAIRQNLLALCAASAAILIMALPAAAMSPKEPPLTVDGGKFMLTAIGHTFKMPLPDWLTPAERLSPDIKPLLKINYLEDPAEALLELYPKGQDEDNWTTMFGARITLQPGRALTDYRDAARYGYSQTCDPKLTGFFQFSKDDGNKLGMLGFVCGAYLDTLKGYEGQGEVMIMQFNETPKGVAILYQEWRGKAFDPSDPKTWPVDAAALQARAAQIKADAEFVAAD